jgi:hypothetical protein
MTLIIQKPTGAKVVLKKDGVAATDTNIREVSLLLHGNGTNGSTTITDSSLTPKTVTAVGNAQISTAQSKFGGASIALDGTGDCLTIPAITFTGDFTLEAWLYKTARDGSGYSVLFSTSVSSPPANNNQFAYDATTEGSIITAIAGSAVIGASGTSVPTNNWCHLAWTRSGSTVRQFVNGTQQGSNGTSSATFNISMIGALTTASFEVNGYIDEVRITNGVARYTANFTPPTLPFPDF